MRVAKKILKIIGLSIVALIALAGYATTLLPIVFAVMPVLLRPEVDAMVKAIEAKGQPVSMVDLAGPAIPEAENGAVVYAEIFRRMDEPQASRDFEVLARFALRKQRSEGAVVWSEARKAVLRNKPILAMLDEATSRPKCRFPVNWNVGPLDVEFPHLAKLRALTRLACAGAVLDAKDGNMDEAVRSLELGYRLSETIRDEPSLIPQLTRLYIIRTSSAALRDVSARGEIRDTQAKRLFDVLQGIDLHDSLEIALIGERAMGIAFFEATREDPWTLSEPDSPDSKARSRRTSGKRTSGFWRALMYADERFYLRTMNRWVDLARLPYREVKLKRLACEPKFPRYAIISAIMTPIFHAKCWELAKSRVAGSQVLLALLAFKDRFGEYPDTLDQLRAKLGWKLSEDPFSGKDFVYERTGKGFLLYSIGPDLKDDGGTPAPADRDEGDIVWRMDH